MVKRFVVNAVTVASVIFIGLGTTMHAQNRALPGQAGLPAPSNPLVIPPMSVPGTLIGTGYVNSSGWCGGPMIDLTAAAGSGVTVTGFEMYFKGTVNRNVSVYWKAGTYVGSETTPGAWTLLSTVNVTPGGDGTLTPVAIGGLGIPASQTYGLKVWDGGTGGGSGPGLDLRSGGTTASDSNLSMASSRYSCNAIFGENSGGFGWQGNILYSLGGPVPTMGIETIALLFVLLAGIAAMALRRRSESHPDFVA